MMPYPEKIISAVAYLFRPYNDIDIYVEDTVCLGMYEVLFNRMLNGKAKIRRVFQMGGREQVITACKQCQKNSRGRSSLYIIDGDFDALLSNTPSLKLKYLYQLAVFSSENLVFSQSAVVQVAYECLTDFTRDKVENIIKFNEFCHLIIKLLRPLFVIYGATFRLDRDIGTVKHNVMQLTDQCKKSGIKISKAKIQNRIEYVKSQLQKKYSKTRINSEVQAVNRLVPKDDKSFCRVICGKEYLMPLVYHYLKTKAGFQGNIKQLKVQLAKYCELNIDPGLFSAVTSASKLK